MRRPTKPPRRAWLGEPGRQWTVLVILLAMALVSTLLGTLLDDQQTWAGAVVTFILLQLVLVGRARKKASSSSRTAPSPACPTPSSPLLPAMAF